MKKRNMKYTRKQRGGQISKPQKKNESMDLDLGATLANGYINILEFIKNKLARFAGLKPIQEENSDPSLAEKGAEQALNTLNSVLQNPNVKRGIALASEKLATTLEETARVAKDKLDDPEFQETLFVLVQFMAQMTTRFVNAVDEPLGRFIDKYSANFEKLLRKMSIAIANAMMDFLQVLPFVGEAIAFVNLMHTFAMLFLSILDSFYKMMQTGVSFIGEVSENLNSSTDSNDGFSKIRNMLKPSIDKYTEMAKSKYEDLKRETLKPTISKVPVDVNSSLNLMKGGKKRIQKRIQKTFRDYYNTNKTLKRYKK